MLLSEIKDSLRRFALRIEMVSGGSDSAGTSWVSALDVFEVKLSEANRHFEKGEFSLSKKLVLDAAIFQATASERLGLDLLNFKFWDSEVTGSIGHTALALGNRVALDKLGQSDGNRKLVLYSQVANPHYLELWNSYFDIRQVAPEVEAQMKLRLWPLRQGVSFVTRPTGPLYAHSAWSLGQRARSKGVMMAPLAPDRDIVEKGLGFLTRWGFPHDGWFVTLHVREEVSPGVKSPRNSTISNYLPGIESITEAGGWVIRIGSTDSTPIPAHSRVIDLTELQSRPSWIDVFLLARSRFMIGTTSGPAVAAMTFGVPVLWTNLTGIGYMPFCAETLVLPKLAQDSSTGHRLSLKETIEAGFAWLETEPSRVTTVRKDLTWLENDEADILGGVEEMLAEQYSDEPTRLQAEFAAEIEELNCEGGPPRCSNSFLERHYR